VREGPGRPGPVRAYLGLGSNLGDRLETLRRAVELLQAREGVRVVRSSSVYETEPVGPPQPEYLNAVLEVETDLEPRALLRACLDVERELGRQRREPWGPRTIDVDVLTYGELEVDEPDLRIPHPRMGERAFVLVPLGELRGEGQPVATGVRLFAPPLRAPGPAR
jgi:2-amino-4-hydroxy-6-hydroxymethyldihydropteridine diphosphokinase